jgi:hypothetical protein
MKSLKMLVGTSVLTCACLSSPSAPLAPSYPEGVAKVLAHVRGITCPTCGAVAEVALRQRLPGVAAISISQSQQTVVVEFAQGASAFSSAVLRDAVDDAGIEVLAIQIDACGVVEETPGQRWFVAGANRFALDDGGGTPAGRPVCVSGSLNDGSTPYRFTPTTIQTVATEVRPT